MWRTNGSSRPLDQEKPHTSSCAEYFAVERVGIGLRAIDVAMLLELLTPLHQCSAM